MIGHDSLEQHGDLDLYEVVDAGHVCRLPAGGAFEDVVGAGAAVAALWGLAAHPSAARRAEKKAGQQGPIAQTAWRAREAVEVVVDSRPCLSETGAAQSV
ncbi:MAG TPA: hypothetical protein VGL99_13680, partial [Chloroflexota bacterium]